MNRRNAHDKLLTVTFFCLSNKPIQKAIRAICTFLVITLIVSILNFLFRCLSRKFFHLFSNTKLFNAFQNNAGLTGVCRKSAYPYHFITESRKSHGEFGSPNVELGKWVKFQKDITANSARGCRGNQTLRDRVSDPRGVWGQVCPSLHQMATRHCGRLACGVCHIWGESAVMSLSEVKLLAAQFLCLNIRSQNSIPM